MAVGATGTGGINATAKSLGGAESGLKGFRAGLAHIKGETGPSLQVPAVGEGCLSGDPAFIGAHWAQLFKFWRLLTGESNSPTQFRGG